MDSFLHIEVTYSKWKDMRIFLGGTVNSYYTHTPEHYILVLVDLTRKFVTICHLRFADPSAHDNIVDFESNIKSTSIVQLTVDDCVAAAIIG